MQLPFTPTFFPLLRRDRDQNRCNRKQRDKSEKYKCQHQHSFSALRTCCFKMPGSATASICCGKLAVCRAACSSRLRASMAPEKRRSCVVSQHTLPKQGAMSSPCGSRDLRRSATASDRSCSTLDLNPC